MSNRWTIAVVAVVAAALIAGLVVELRRTEPPTPTGPVGAEHDGSGAALAEPRRRADLPSCSAGLDGDGPTALRGVIVECAADGAPVDAARMLAGRRVVLNLWAYWCVPCRAELPAMAEYQRLAGPAVMVVTVHQDENEAAALALLADLGVRLPTLQDGLRRVAAALRVPNVMPATVVLTADGSVARILPRAFADAGEIAAAVGDQG
ncbi:MAG TPA: TlpA disulfide reductase family protein [Mycobacterium sp.]|nr:TlpA disulfide reductase family protein [Mycobacterium sp.]